MDKTVGEIMVRDVMITSKDESVADAAKKMAERNIGSIVVVEGSSVIGILTERDLVKKVVSKGLDSKKLKVGGVMSSNVITVAPSDSVIEASKFMRYQGIKKLPVVEGGKLVGIITELDVAEELRNELLQIIPDTEEPTVSGNACLVLSPGSLYLVKEDKLSKSLDLFVNVVKQGIPGLCISRTHPEKIRLKHKLEKTPMIWLTDTKTDHPSISPNCMTELSLLISKFLKDTERSVILLDGIEYLITQNSYNQALRLVQRLRDKVAASKSHLIIPVCYAALNERDLKLLEGEMDVVIHDLEDIKEKVKEMEEKGG